MLLMGLLQLRSEEEGETRRRGIRESMRTLRSEVKAEIRELETPPSDASDTESQKENHPHSSPSVGRVALSTKASSVCFSAHYHCFYKEQKPQGSSCSKTERTHAF